MILKENEWIGIEFCHVVLTRHRNYERKKDRIRKMILSPEKYEDQIKRLAEGMRI